MEKTETVLLSYFKAMEAKYANAIKKIRKMCETLRPGIMGLWYHHGPMTFEQRKTCLRLIGTEVLPAMREMAKEFDLPGPFEMKPGSRPLPISGKRDQIVPDIAAA